MEEEERKKKLFLLYRWDILKEKRKEMYTEMMKEKMLKYRKRFWIQGSVTAHILKHIFNVFDAEREAATRKAKIQFAVNMFAIKFRLWSQKKRKTMDERARTTAR